MGIKTVSQKELSGTLFILNEPLAYNHVLSFRFPICLLQGKDDVVDAKLYPYIPLQNIVEKYFTDNIKDEYKYEIKYPFSSTIVILLWWNTSCSNS